jgi:hypothetical protein
MDCVIYVASRYFVLVAAHTGLDLQEGNLTSHVLKCENVRKVYRISDSVVAIVTGIPRTAGKLLEFLDDAWNSGLDFNDAVQSLQERFSTNRVQMEQSLDIINQMMESAVGERGLVDIEKVASNIEDPVTRALFLDYIAFVAMDMPGNVVDILGYSTTGIYEYVALQQAGFLIGETEKYGDEDFMNFRVISNYHHRDELAEIENWMMGELNEIWATVQSEHQGLDAAISQTSKLLSEAVTKLYPFNTNLDIVIYELSLCTGSKFTSPDAGLKNLLISSH